MLHIPEDKLPDEYKDEARLNSLYSPFRSRTVNPKDWDAKILSWKHLIALYCTNNAVYSFSLPQLSALFMRDGRPPSCLAVVVEELVKNGDLQYIEDFLKDAPKSWTTWAANLLVKKPLSWSFNTLKRSLFSTSNNPECTYVHVEVVRAESLKLLAIVPESSRNKLMNLTEFSKVVNKDLAQADNMKLVLHHLVQEGKADVTTLKKDSISYEMFLVKIGDLNKVEPITETDIAAYVLEQNEKVFEKHVEELEDEIAKCVKTIKDHLLKGHRQLAKTCLKKKHEIEKRLTRKINALHNVQVLLERVKDVHGDAKVWTSYKHAISAFNNTCKETGLNEDAVEDTMLHLAEMLDMHDDIQSTISRSITNEDEDLEEALAELMKNDNDEQTGGNTSGNLDEELAKLDLTALPDVPNASISIKESPMH